MTRPTAAAFGRALKIIYDEFAANEQDIRAGYGRVPGEPDEVAQRNISDLLERPTRRFVIDRVLQSLGWDADDAARVAEEARSRDLQGPKAKALFFDYLGLARDRSPAALIEAKGFDADLPRQPREAPFTRDEMSRVLSRELDRIKVGSGASTLLAIWTEWLTDLRTYVLSLDPADRDGLARVVITSGRWMIVFEDPAACFVTSGPPDPDKIHCFRTPAEIVGAGVLIFELLQRDNLVDTLPLTLSARQALEVLQPGEVTALFRGAVVATTRVGPQRDQHPYRSATPALVLVSGGRCFAVTSYGGGHAAEPLEASKIPEFLADLDALGTNFETNFLKQLGRPDLTPSPIEDFPADLPDTVQRVRRDPVAGSTGAARLAGVRRRGLVRPTGERNSASEFLVIAGTQWFHKLGLANGTPCLFHNFPEAMRAGAAAADGDFVRTESSFSTSGDVQHCAHDPLRGLRSGRCEVIDIDMHLCCRACAYHAVCWPTPQELRRMPCAA